MSFHEIAASEMYILVQLGSIRIERARKKFWLKNTLPVSVLLSEVTV